MAYYPVIGIETHVQLNTKTKLFCSCLNEYAPDEPNKNICPFCTGQPGALPALNKEAVKKAIKFGVAINGTIPEKTRWDRKNYFYPDLPAGYQISQYDNPIIEQGRVDFYIEDKNNGQFKPCSVALTRAHLEADAGKLMHAGGKTYVDFNRSGAPLIEIVTDPVVKDSAEAMAYVAELQLLVRKIGISDADMEKGQMRFDCNLSLQTEEEHAAGRLPKYKVEVKNINSIRAIGRAVEFEIKRQTELLNNGQIPSQETRGWRDDLNKSESQRSKEEAQDYRYFPEPDLRILEIKSEDIPSINDLPELPQVQRQRYLELGLNLQTVNTFVNKEVVGHFFDEILQQVENKDLIRAVANIITVNLLALSEKQNKPIQELISKENLLVLSQLLSEKKINNQGLSKSTEILANDFQANAQEVVETNGLIQENDDSALEEFVNTVIEKNPAQVEQYKSGKVQILDYLVGQSMKESRGKGNPQKFRDIFIKKLTN